MTAEYRIPSPVKASSIDSHYAALDTRIDAERNNSFTCTASYVNGTNMNIVITTRSGFAVTIKPSNNINTGELHIFFNYRIGAHGAITPNSLVRQAEENLPDDLKAIKLSLERVKKLDKLMFGESSTSFDIVYKVPADLFTTYNGAIHLTELGITLSVARDDNIIIVNPDSETGRKLTDGETPSIPGLSYRVEINDPDKRYGVRYLNLSGRIFRVEPTTDHTKIEGVYVHTNAIEVRPNERLKNRYEFSESDEALKLYRTYEEALHSGDIATQKQRDFEEEKHRIRMESLEAEREKTALNNQSTMMKTLLDRFSVMEQNAQRQHELYVESQKQLEAEREERRKRENDDIASRRQSERNEREAERKEKLEYIKWCTAAAVAVTTLVAVLGKTNKKQS